MATTGHAFLSYVRDDLAEVDRLAADLRVRHVDVWLDRQRILPGRRWRDAIREAIESGAIFVACFSQNYCDRSRSYMNEELTLAIDVLRQMPTNRSWLVPVLFSKISIPDRFIGGGDTLKSLQWVDLTDDWRSGVDVLASIARRPTSDLAEIDSLLQRAERLDQRMQRAKINGSTVCDVASDPQAEVASLFKRVGSTCRDINSHTSMFNIVVETSEHSCVIRAAGHTVELALVCADSLITGTLEITTFEGYKLLRTDVETKTRELDCCSLMYAVCDSLPSWVAADGSTDSSQRVAEFAIDLLLDRAEARSM